MDVLRLLRKRFKEIKIKISPGNVKMGAIPAVSLMPVATCPPGVPCAKACYDMRCCQLRPLVLRARLHNWTSYKLDPEMYFQDIVAYIKFKKPKFFRFHVGGDIPNLAYMVAMNNTARLLPETNFLCFTKNHEIVMKVFVGIPKNLQMVLSMWPGWGEATHRSLPRAWMQDGTEDRVPKGAIECAGNCETCGMCWQLSEIGKDVILYKH